MPSATPSPDAPAPLVGEVIAIGDELTTGQRLDTNTQWLAQRLTEAGVDVRFHTTVADHLAANVAVFRTAAERANVIVATGGLGPTADDLTRDAIAEAARVPLVEDPALVAHIEGVFRSRGREMPPQNRRQAQLPRGAAAIPNPGGTAPGVDLAFGRGRVFALPGVPAEMREMWDQTVGPAVVGLDGPRRVVRHRLVRCFGAGESHIESMLPEMIARGREPLVGITASKATITLRVTASGVDEAACYEAMAPTLEEIQTTLGDLVFAECRGDERETELQDVLLEQIIARRLTLATTEAMTAGLLGYWLGEADADRGLVVSSERVCLGSATPIEDALGWVEDAAKQLAAEADCTIAIGPRAEDPAQGVAVAAATPRGVVSKAVTLVGHPSIHRPLVAKHALNLLRLELR